jgi:tryptophan 7-halogenase
MAEQLDIVIVGGGTAGWMSAAALVSATDRGRCRVTLIESEEIGSVGVGEATLPQMKDFNDYIGVLEADMMQKTGASFKLGIEFRDWGYVGASYIHPFGTYGKKMRGADFLHQWTRAKQHGAADEIESYSYAIQACRQSRFDFPVENQEELNSTYAYAYHFDASLYARYLRQFSESRGIMRIEGKIVDVELDPTNGHIRSLRLESGATVTGDYFIDCSGFRSLLMGQTLQVPFEDWSQWLPCDRAWAVPCEGTEPVLPYTRSTAKAAGWQWRIPLQHRIGNGYVYSSHFIGDDEACQSLLQDLDGKALAEPKPLKFKAGRRKRSWQGNCIAVGLASGFLEPLESTSIYLIQIGILNLIKLFPNRRPDPALIDEYNRLVDYEYERVRDFLILHYHLNRRDDSELWRYCRNMQVPDSLRQKMEMFRHRGFIDTYRHGLFAPPSWIAVFLGQGLRPEGWSPIADVIPLDSVMQEMRELPAAIKQRVQMMPEHGRFLADYCPAVRSPL